MTVTKLSASADKLYKRIQLGKWYPAFDPRTPKAMQELIGAGLVGTAGRPQTVVSCYVPMTGYTPYRPERFKS